MQYNPRISISGVLLRTKKPHRNGSDIEKKISSEDKDVGIVLFWDVNFEMYW